MGRLFIMCGHGAGDSGAVGGGYTEAERVRALGSLIKQMGGDSVVLLDTSVNYYASAGRWDSLGITKSDWLCELHMDSAAASARGAHVIISASLDADEYDKRLAAGVSALFPGRSQTISKRSDLANPKRAAARGINYRLIENGFISNATDRDIFNTRMSELADIYLTTFGIKAGSPAPEPSQPTQSGAIDVDGLWGESTTLLAQKVTGAPYCDGKVSRQNPDHRWRVPGCTTGWEWGIGDGSGSPLIKLLQKAWGADPDGIMGPDTINAMISYYMAKGSGATVCDGNLGLYSPTIKQFQRELNEGRV